MLFSYRENLKTSSDCGLVYPRMQFEIEIACYKKRRMNDVVVRTTTGLSYQFMDYMCCHHHCDCDSIDVTNKIDSQSQLLVAL